MSRIPFIHARFPASSETELAINRRLRSHLTALRSTALRRVEDNRPPKNQMAPETDTGLENDDNSPPLKIDPRAHVELTGFDIQRISRRAISLHKARIAASGLSHLKTEERNQLEILRDGVRLVEITSEHRADELAAELHAEFPWLALATEQVWHAMRRSVREGWSGLRLPPLLLDGPPGIGKSVWARRLGTLISVPTKIVEATAENASFGLVGSQHGWRDAAPGCLLQTILQTRIGNPIIIVDEVEKAGTVTSSHGHSFDLASSLLPLLEPATANNWNCPFYGVQFDMGWISWVLTSNDWRRLPEPLLSRCPPVRLATPSLDDLLGFAQREGVKRGLSQISIEALVEALQRMSHRSRQLNLRVVIRMIRRAERLEAAPTQQ